MARHEPGRQARPRPKCPRSSGSGSTSPTRTRTATSSGGELDTAFQSADNMVGGGTTIQAVRGGGSGDVTETHVVWNLHNRSPSNLASPLVVGEQLFVVKKGGLSSSFDAATGKTHWELSPHSQHRRLLRLARRRRRQDLRPRRERLRRRAGAGSETEGPGEERHRRIVPRHARHRRRPHVHPRPQVAVLLLRARGSSHAKPWWLLVAPAVVIAPARE